MFQFKLFNIPVAVQWWFFLLAAFLGGGLYADTPAELQRLVVFIAAAFLSILTHELGHALTGLKFGAPAAFIALHGMGGSAHFPGERFSRKQRILMTAAGPGASIALAIVALVIGMLLLQDEANTLPRQQSLLSYFISTLVFINLFWSFINLCPVLPMDGGQILRDVLGPSRLRLTCIISFITLGILATLLWLVTQSIFNLIIAFLLGSHTWNVFKQTQANS